MAASQPSLSSLAAVADATMAPSSPQGSDVDWDFVDPTAAQEAKEAEIQRQSDDLRVQEGAWRYSAAHAGGAGPP